MIDWLDYNGYTVVTKPTKEYVDAAGRRNLKGNMDIELAVDAMEMSIRSRCSPATECSGLVIASRRPSSPPDG